MPQLRREMSWLSPRRRKTDGNLRGAAANGQYDNQSISTSTSTSPSLERPSTVHRPVTQPTGIDPNMDGNLFYAYARKDDEFNSRYLLTFASAPVANEWWLLLQIHFPETSRPSPQIFAFKSEDLLSNAWKHPSFAHLKSKWMYISFSDTPGNALGGAAQGIIPVQDAQGNMLGRSVSTMDDVLPEVKEEAREVKDEVGRMEETFSKMMEALQANTEKSAELAAKILSPDNNAKTTTREVNGMANGTNGSSLDMDALSNHFSDLNQALAKSSQQVETLAEKHHDNEQKLRSAIETMSSKQNNDSLDMQQLSSHLDRIQGMMEAAAKERKDSALVLPDHAPQVDLSPLTERLQKVQEAIEQNSALVKALLDEGTSGTESREQPAPLDMAPLQESMERIHSAIAQQSEHTKALVGYASGEGEGGESGVASQERNLAPLSEHLEQIYNAIEEGNKHAKSRQDVDLTPFERHFEKLQDHDKQNSTYMVQLLESQNSIWKAVEANGGELDFTPVITHLEGIRESTDASTETLKRHLENQEDRSGRAIDFTHVMSHLGSIKDGTEQNSEHLRGLLESHQEFAAKPIEHPEIDWTSLTERLDNIHTTLEGQSEDTKPIDWDPLIERLDNIHTTLERQSEDTKSTTGNNQTLMTNLTTHLSKVQTAIEQNASHVKSLREKQSTSATKMQTAVSETSDQIRQLIERNEKNEAKIDAQNSQMRELMSGQREMVEVMRQLAKTLAQQNKETCSHVVVPPPRKMNRKLVGFVYDTKDGMP